MNRWVLAATTTAMLAALAGCNSDSDNDDAVVEPPAAVTPDSINLSFLGRYSAGIFAESAAEIPAFDPVNKRIFIVNAQKGAVDVLDATDPANPTLIDTLTAADVAADAVVNSIAYKGGYLAVAIEASPKTDNGFVALYDATTLDLLGSAQVGAQPDMLAFSPDGKYLLTANEGEPSNDYSVDPVGSISILSLTDDEIVEVRSATFSSFNARRDELIQAGVRIFGPNASVEQDLEPEYIAISEDSSTAWVALQENNALAKIDIGSATVTNILPLGYKDHGVAGNGLDVSDEDGEINITTWPGVLGMYQPDAIAAYSAGGNTTWSPPTKATHAPGARMMTPTGPAMPARALLRNSASSTWCTPAALTAAPATTCRRNCVNWQPAPCSTPPPSATAVPLLLIRATAVKTSCSAA
ncbi:choice-of-anchor I family protein [Halopseudomonas pachastrellae]|nr:choice-of-anchor I family protein [Halopseudomonas pachastrellae]